MKYNCFLSRFILTLMISFLSFFSSEASDNGSPKFKNPDFAYPQTVLKDARGMLKKADTAGEPYAGEMRLRAAIEICSAAQSIDYDSIFTQPAMVERLIAASSGDKAAQAMLTIYEAKLYSDIYTARKYKYDRVDAPLEPYPADISAWSGLQFRTRIAAILKEALAEAPQTPLDRFSASLDYSPRALEYLPTVADFVRYTASQIYDNLRTVKENYLAERKAICEEGIKAAKEGSAPYFYWSCALIEIENRGDDLTKALDSLYAKWKDNEAARYVLAELAERSQGRYNYYIEEPLEETEDGQGTANDAKIARRDKLISFLKASLSQFPSWYNNNALRNALNSLSQPSASIEAPSMVAPGTPFDTKRSLRQWTRRHLQKTTCAHS